MEPRHVRPLHPFPYAAMAAALACRCSTSDRSSLSCAERSSSADERRAAKLGSCTGDLPATFTAQQQAHETARNRARCQSGLTVQQLAEIETGPTASLLFGLTALRARIQQLIEKRLGLVDHQDVFQFKPMPR